MQCRIYIAFSIKENEDINLKYSAIAVENLKMYYVQANSTIKIIDHYFRSLLYVMIILISKLNYTINLHAYMQS